MRPAAESAVNEPSLNRRRYDAHSARLANHAAERQRRLDAKKAAAARRVPAP
jgi:hypothetical protein